MLNIGQVVYDSTNKRVLIFGGIGTFFDGDFYSCVSFLTDSLKEIKIDSRIDDQFEYDCIKIDQDDNNIFVGEFVKDAELDGDYFGLLNWDYILNNQSWTDSLLKTIAEAKNIVKEG